MGAYVLRFLTTWEAIEHAGPGQYDQAYLQYVRDVLIVAARHGIAVHIDHQDVWCRWTGGDGAPGWTLELAGFEPRNFEACGAAKTIETYGGTQEDFPPMQWPMLKLAAATMFTLFFGGKRFAPGCTVLAAGAKHRTAAARHRHRGDGDGDGWLV